ncbi:MAG TPA: MFS transporter [Steroidobacteraceae bacterium]|nr:MFS transporter [Steroidobacteraceae bacterium]
MPHLSPKLTQLSGQEHRSQLRRAVIAATIGTAIEWYDFFLYSSVTGLVFARLFFPQSSPLTGALQAFTVYLFGFVARPIGAAIFGHFGDRIGRKSTLILTLALMGMATFLVGLVPTYASIGVWGAVILTILRFIQGVGVGGEWGGSVLLAMEWARTNKHRGFVTSWPQLGVPLGMLLANLAVLLSSRVSGDGFLEWGWRIPFLLSISLIGVGLYIRLGIQETPTFQALTAKGATSSRPVPEVIHRHWREILLSALARTVQQASFYVLTAFIFSYGTTVLGSSRDFLLVAMMAASVLSCITNPLFGFLSDRVGRKRVYTLGIWATALFAFAYFAILDTRIPALIFLAIAVSLVPHDMMYGPQAALIAESFPARLRYSGASLGYHLASIISGGPAPLIATALFARYRSGHAIAIYLAACAVISAIATRYLTDHTNEELDDRDVVSKAR